MQQPPRKSLPRHSVQGQGQNIRQCCIPPKVKVPFLGTEFAYSVTRQRQQLPNPYLGLYQQRQVPGFHRPNYRSGRQLIGLGLPWRPCLLNGERLFQNALGEFLQRVPLLRGKGD